VGRLKYLEKDLSTHRYEILKKIGAVIEKPDLYKYLTAYQNLSIFARISGIKTNRTLLMQQLEQVGLADRANSKVKPLARE
jgi:ABC-type multidrug transport system ATPase subunit